MMDIGDEKRRVDYMESIGATCGVKRTIKRNNIFADVISIYRQDIVREYPLFIGYESENAIDEGGVSRDMLSAFWEAAYQTLFDGANILVPFIYPSTDLAMFSVLGRIISHGYLASEFLPIRISFPSLPSMLLGSALADIPKSFQLDALMDYISASERDKLKSALRCKGTSFSVEMRSALVSTLSRFDCRDMPTPSNLADLIVKVARHEFNCKPIGVIAMIHSSILEEHSILERFRHRWYQ